MRLTPGGTFCGAVDEPDEATGKFEYIKQLDKMDIAFLAIKLSDDQDELHGGKIVPME